MLKLVQALGSDRVDAGLVLVGGSGFVASARSVAGGNARTHARTHTRTRNRLRNALRNRSGGLFIDYCSIYRLAKFPHTALSGCDPSASTLPQPPMGRDLTSTRIPARLEVRGECVKSAGIPQYQNLR